MEDFNRKELKKIANDLKPQFNVGKGGVGEGFIESIDKYLQAHSVVKIKILSAESKDEVSKVAHDISIKVDADILDKKGFTFVLFRD